jgi:hypothetical protein
MVLTARPGPGPRSARVPAAPPGVPPQRGSAGPGCQLPCAPPMPPATRAPGARGPRRCPAAAEGGRVGQAGRLLVSMRQAEWQTYSLNSSGPPAPGSAARARRRPLTMDSGTSGVEDQADAATPASSPTSWLGVTLGPPSSSPAPRSKASVLDSSALYHAPELGEWSKASNASSVSATSAAGMDGSAAVACVPPP